MKEPLLLLYAVLFNTNLLAQKHGVDTLSGYIVRTNDTVAGHVILPYRMAKDLPGIEATSQGLPWNQD